MMPNIYFNVDEDTSGKTAVKEGDETKSSKSIHPIYMQHNSSVYLL